MDRGRVTEKEEVRIQVGQHVDIRTALQYVEEERRAAGPVVLKQRPLSLDRSQRRVRPLQLRQPDEVDAVQPQVRKRSMRPVIQAQGPEHERWAVPGKRAVQR